MLRYGDTDRAAELAPELEALGYSALWIPDVGGDVFGPLANLLGATTTATIATGILNVWMHTPEETAAEHAKLTAAHGPRFLCGVGISHRPFIDHVNSPGTYQNPVETMAGYLDGLDAAEVPLAKDDRVLAALGPKMLELARTRTAGTHPYLVTPELTARARAGIGDGLVASEQGVVLDTDPDVGAGHRPPAPQDLPRRCRTTRTTGSARGSPTTTSPTAAATVSSMRSSCGATRRRSPPASRSTATPAPTTSASRCSPTTRRRSRSTSGGPSHPRSPSDRPIGAGPSVPRTVWR